jgi:hypothetical protein
MGEVVLLACVEIAEWVKSTNKRDNDAWRMDRRMVETDEGNQE